VTAVRVRHRRGTRLRYVWDSEWRDLIIAASAAWLLVFPTGLLDMPFTIDRLTVDNPTVYDISLAVSDADGESWLPVLIVDRESTAWTTNVIDQGDIWRFRVRSQGRAGGELTIPRAELEAAGFRLTLPSEVGERLARYGAPPSPR
jgi:hypothetical protein